MSSLAVAAGAPRDDQQRITDRETTIAGLRDFRDQAIARLAAQHNEITRLRTQNKRAAAVRLLPAPASDTAPCT